MSLAVVSVAGNLDPARHIPSGLRRLHAVAPIAAVSRFRVTPALDRPTEPDYWNGAALVETALDPAAFRGTLRTIEAAAGRVRGPDRWAARELDLDLLVWGGAVVDPDIRARPWLTLALHDLGIAQGPPPADPYPPAPVHWP